MDSIRKFMEATFIVLMGLMVVGIVVYFLGFFLGAGFNTGAHFGEPTIITQEIL